MARIIRGIVGATVLTALTGACAGSASGGGLTTGLTGGLTTGAQQPSCEPPCGQHAGCNLSAAGGPACACDQSYTSCPGGGSAVCVNALVDPDNCGGCGLACPQRQVCTDGQCACPVSSTIVPCEIDGGLQCVDLTIDGNCGGCGISCDQNQECAATASGPGNCVCVDGGPGVRFESCGGTCVDTNQDPFNCGGCSVVCVSGSCIVGDAGTGVCNCPSPYTLCGQNCVDLTTDPYYCGSCDLFCYIQGVELACSDGHCFCGPTGRDELCPDGTCSLLSGNPQNCGQCGNVCVPPNQACVDGGCVPG